MEPYPFARFERHQVDALGIDTAYYTAGNPQNPTHLLIHGMHASGDTFRELMHGLQDTCYLIAPDIPGFGHSEKPSRFTISHLCEWLAAFIDELELGPVHLSGHSFGGLLTAAYALTYPEDVLGLIHIAPALLANEDYPDWFLKIGDSVNYLGFVDVSVAYGQRLSIATKQVKLSFVNKNQHPEIWERRIQEYQNARSSADVMKAVGRTDIHQHLDNLPRPYWLIWGDQDNVLPIKHAHRLLERYPDITFRELKPCGHIPPLEKWPELITIYQQYNEAFISPS
ncbi:MAG TPA: alpha/beta hydrolase [Anaerolineae bacterium]|nr:alpha/beta hydrolase [Anaerolineae bacterium]